MKYRLTSLLALVTLSTLAVACAAESAPLPSDAGVTELGDASELGSVTLAQEQTRGLYTDGDRCHAFGSCGSGRSNRELYCDAFIQCLEEGRGAAECEAWCAGDEWCRDRLTYYSERNRRNVTLLQCLRANGGIGCFRNTCSHAPDTSTCPNQARWLRYGGGYASYRKSCY